jgi:hypothetical protein
MRILGCVACLRIGNLKRVAIAHMPRRLPTQFLAFFEESWLSSKNAKGISPECIGVLRVGCLAAPRSNPYLAQQ